MYLQIEGQGAIVDIGAAAEAGKKSRVRSSTRKSLISHVADKNRIGDQAVAAGLRKDLGKSRRYMKSWAA